MINETKLKGHYIEIIKLKNGNVFAKIQKETSSYMFDTSVAKLMIEELNKFIEIAEGELAND
nr:hypothetical protein [Methanobrevibacter arboriphilus]